MRLVLAIYRENERVHSQPLDMSLADFVTALVLAAQTKGSITLMSIAWSGEADEIRIVTEGGEDVFTIPLEGRSAYLGDTPTITAS